jgi:ABC-type branched-subunit amino acid transport system ATPase component
MGELLRLERVTVNFGGVRALSNVSFAVPSQSITALIGPNGAGKTTCFNVICGVQVPDVGSVTFSGKDITKCAPHDRWGIGRTFQISQLFGSMTVRENIMVGFHRWIRGGLLLHGLRLPFVTRQEREAASRADAILQRLGLEAFASRPASSLPLGHQRLLELGRALAGDPQLILLDEAASGLSAAEMEVMSAQVRQLERDGCTVLLVEHNMRFVNRLASHLIVLNFGEVIFEGTTEEGVSDRQVADAYLGTRP